MTSRKILIVDPVMGMAGDMFSAAMIGLGVPAGLLTGAMENAARTLGGAIINVERVETGWGPAVRLRIKLESKDPHLGAEEARSCLETALEAEDLADDYASFARHALDILIVAEREAHSSLRPTQEEGTLHPIGLVHTPYHHHAPYQPSASAQGEFYVEVFPQFAAGLSGIETLSHIFIITHLHLSRGYSLTVTPPWRKGSKPTRMGLFATRSPNRPNPLGLTLAEVRGVDGNRIYTSPLDLFDGTPVVDIKPHIRSLDETIVGDDGWLAGTDHLELHKKGIPHEHGGEEAVLHEARDILIDVVGAAKGLEFLKVALDQVICLTPVSVGGGTVKFSHGELAVPTPAVEAILKSYRIPHVSGPVEAELLTPTGAALLAALSPEWLPRGCQRTKGSRRGLGLGTKNVGDVNGLWLSVS